MIMMETSMAATMLALLFAVINGRNGIGVRHMDGHDTKKIVPCIRSKVAEGARQKSEA